MDSNDLKFSTDIHGHLKVNCKNFSDPLTYHLGPESGHIFKLSSTLIYDQIP